MSDVFWLIMLALWVLSFPLSEWAKKRQARRGVSRNPGSGRGARTSTQTGPKWEQDKPYNLDETGDDL